MAKGIHIRYLIQSVARGLELFKALCHEIHEYNLLITESLTLDLINRLKFKTAPYSVLLLSKLHLSVLKFIQLNR